MTDNVHPGEGKIGRKFFSADELKKIVVGPAAVGYAAELLIEEGLLRREWVESTSIFTTCR